MNRRNFLKRLEIGLAVAGGAAVLPKILNPSVPPTTYRTYIVCDQALTLADLRKCKESLVSMQVTPRNGFVGWVHPNTVADIVGDNDKTIRFKWTYQAAPPVRGQRLRFIDAT